MVDRFINKSLHVYILYLLNCFSLLMDEDLNLFILWEQINYQTDKDFKKTFYKFFKEYKNIKCKTKKQKICYNKIYKILFFVIIY